MRLSITNFSTVQQDLDFRIDSDFYSHPFRQKLIELKSKLEFSTLKKETEFIGSGHTPYKHNMQDGDIPFITVECVWDLEFSYDKTKRITDEQYEAEYKNKIIEKGAIICTIKRRICKAYPFLSEIKSMALNQDVALIYPKEKLLSGFLAVYFNCSFGQGFADRLKTEQMNPYISLVNLAKLPIPLLDIVFQQSIEDIVLLSQQIKSKLESTFKEAENILLSELGLTNWQPKHQLTFIKNYSDTQEAGRIDAEYYQPKYDEIVQAIKSYSGGWDTLGKLCTTKRGSLIPKDFYSEKAGAFYIRGADFSGGLLSDAGAVFINNRFESTGETKVKINEIVFSLIGSVGETALVTEDFQGSFISNNTGKISCHSINPVFLQVLFQSKIGQSFFEKYKMQTAQPKISDKDVQKFLVPKFSESKQQEIQKKVTESFNLRKQSKHLLESAKKAVEMAIEQDEQTAIKWLQKEIQSIGETGASGL